MECFEYVVGAAQILTSGAAVVIAWFAHKHQTEAKREAETSSQRAQVILLWDKVIGLKAIDPLDPVQHDVVYGCHVLNLIATCWSLNVIDDSTAKNVYGRDFKSTFDEIAQIPSGSVLGAQSGEQFLAQDPNVIELYQIVDFWLKNDARVKLPDS